MSTALDLRVLPLHRLFDALEARTMLASVQSFDDVDGDRVTVKVTGPGAAALTLSGGGTGSIQFLQLTGTTTSSGLSISVKQVGGNGQVDLEAMTNNAVLKSLNAPKTNFVGNGTFEINEIRSLSFFDIFVDIDLVLDAPAGRAMSLSIGSLSGGLTFSGPVSSFRMIDAQASCSVLSPDVISSLRVTDGLGGTWQVGRFGSITVGGELTADLRTFTPDAKGYSFGAVRVRDAFNARLRTNKGGTDGRMKSLTTSGDFTGGEITLLGIDTLRCNDDFRPESLYLSEESLDAFAVKTLTIADGASGDWRFSAPIGAIKIGRAENGLDVSNGGPNMHVRSLTFTQPEETNLGDWDFGSLRTLVCKGGLSGNWRFEGTIPGSPLSCKSFTAARLEGFVIDEEAAGGIGTLTANHVFNSDITARFFGTVNIKRRAGGDGDLIGSRVRARSVEDNNPNDVSIRALNVAGEAGDSFMITRGSVLSATFGKFLACTLFVGHVDPLAKDVPPVFGDATQADITATLGSFTVKGPFAAGVPVFGLGVNVLSAHINKITIAGLIDPANGGQKQGFASGLFGSIKFKDVDGSPLSLNGAALAAGDTPLLPLTSVDLVVRNLT